MRIELNYGGLFSGTSVKDLQKDIKNLIKKSDNTIDGFKKIKTFAYNMNGGVGCLQDAVDQIDARINAEETKKSNLIDVQNKVDHFLNNTRRTDKEVGALVKKNKNEFYKLHPWAKPSIKDTVKNWIEKAGKWLAKAKESISKGFEQLVTAINKFNNWATDTLHKVWNSAVNWFKENWGRILKVTLTVIAITVCVVVIVINPLSFPAFVASMALIGAAVNTTSGVIGKSIERGIKGQKMTVDDYIDTIFDGTIKGIGDGIADGIGAKFGPLGKFLAGEITKPLSNIIVDGTNHIIDNNGSLEGFGKTLGKDIIEGTIDNTFDVALDKVGDFIKGKKFVPVDAKSTGNQILFNAPKGAVKESGGTIKITQEVIKGSRYQNEVKKKASEIPFKVGGKVITKTADEVVKNVFNQDKNIIKIKLNSNGAWASVKDSAESTVKGLIKDNGKGLVNGWIENTTKIKFTSKPAYSGAGGGGGFAW